MIEKPFSQACENNKQPILDHLLRVFRDCRQVLEIGSGTGQHSVHFAAHMPWLTWQCTDMEENLPGIRAWHADAGLPNLPEPRTLDVNNLIWPVDEIGAVFSANTQHIMSWQEVELFWMGLAVRLQPGTPVVIYGPFNINGEYTSDSNAAFDAHLKARDPLMGLRDLENIEALAAAGGIRLEENLALPANNRLLIWRRESE